MSYIGVDLHTNSFTICRLEGDGSAYFETHSLCAADLERFCASLDADDELAVEATGNTAWFCEEVRACVGRIVVVNSRQFKVIRQSVKKTDRNDARALAFFLSKDMLPETRLKSTAEAELASLTPHPGRHGQAAHHAVEQDPCPVCKTRYEAEERRAEQQEASLRP